MATVRSRRRAVRAAERVAHPIVPAPRKLTSLINSPAAKTALVVIGAAGLTALAVAVVGPKRIERDVIKPLRGAIEPQAEKLWADSRGLREQIAGLFKSATPTGREQPGEKLPKLDRAFPRHMRYEWAKTARSRQSRMSELGTPRRPSFRVEVPASRFSRR